MKAFSIGAFLLVAGLAFGRQLPPVLLSGDLDTRSHSAETKSQLHYALYVAPYEEIGSVAASKEHPPTSEQLARYVEAALPADRFVAIANKDEAPDVVIGVQWGEISPHGPQPFVSAREGGVVKPIWAIGVGRTHVPPFLMPSQRSDLYEELQRDRYYLLVSAYDPDALRKGKVLIRWQTRTSIDSIQVSNDEAWSYLSGVVQANLAKRFERPSLVSDAPRLSPANDSAPLIAIDDVIPGASKLLTFEKAMPPY